VARLTIATNSSHLLRFASPGLANGGSWTQSRLKGRRLQKPNVSWTVSERVCLGL
jgi:hypothetical protein